ncbi:hypothetical protein SERLADRAFT_443264 [Serpula lacrymans var. lacrymans S7.9]|uniref:Uncharacterized protein n=1 Tax=Serpula lacrymans var. lacrymans (strain S7.9) TaxID=578457 RepID=F8PC23_SERL9|nr:uncharacterized protein SERLADRAFT_443264 [Serpula lacrymans var. lacrymans S7.9]EGO19223.1 hypothetical protein SERLADRAFT_443264 [Serpula lacrymans var. lacrymans S7.9]
MNQPTTLSVITMPIPGTRYAPKKFKGDYTRVRDFVLQYERICHANNVTADDEKCSSILQYCSTYVCKIIEGIKHFITPSCNSLRDEILQYFDGAKAEAKFKEHHLKQLVNVLHKKQMGSLDDFKSYMRKYVCVGGWLLAKSKITQDIFNFFFWKGLSKTLHYHIENRLLQRDPTLDLSQPFAFDDVVKAVEHVLHRDRFDDEDFDSDNLDSDLESDNSSSSLDNSSDSDKEEEPPCYIRRTTKQKKEKKCTSETEKERKLLSPSKLKKTLHSLDKEEHTAVKKYEVETLIKKLGSLTIEDPNYPLLYYRAIKLETDARLILRPPTIMNQLARPS